MDYKICVACMQPKRSCYCIEYTRRYSWYFSYILFRPSMRISCFHSWWPVSFRYTTFVALWTWLDTGNSSCKAFSTTWPWRRPEGFRVRRMGLWTLESSWVASRNCYLSEHHLIAENHGLTRWKVFLRNEINNCCCFVGAEVQVSMSDHAFQ